MKAIIDGKRYDTQTAEMIDCESNGLGRGDFKWCAEWLYRTKKGKWFLHGEGGASSKYSEPACDMRGPGQRLVPMTDAQALAWLEENGKADAIEEHFGDQIEDA